MTKINIKKAVIPAAGLGTRFLPATKAIPKEMLPIVDTPTLQFIVKEAAQSGIEQILIVTNSNKHCMENHFDTDFELEARLRESGKEAEAEMINDIANMANIFYIRQKEPKGLGHAILCARPFIGDEPFAVLLGDDIMVNPGGLPAIKQLIDAYSERRATVVGVQEVENSETYKYGIIAPSPTSPRKGRLMKLSGMVEKPDPSEAPSNFASYGRYVLSPSIFDYLEQGITGVGGEIQLTDAICALIEREAVYAYDMEGKRYDAGEKFGFIKATIDFALHRDEIKDQLSSYIISLAEELKSQGC